MSDEQNRETEQNLKEIEREIREGAETMLSAAEEIAEKAEQSAEAAAPEEAPAEAEAPMEEGASAAQEENLREAEEAAGETVAEVLEEAGRLEDLTREEMESVYPDQQPPADFAADTHIDPEGPAPQPQQFQQPQQPAYGWQGTPQAAPVWQAAPVQGYYAPYPQKKKMSAGLKAFIIIASAMAVLAIGGFTGYLLANRGAPANPMEIIQNYDRDELPFDLPFDLPDGGEEDDEKPFSRPDRDGRDPSGGAEEEPGGENPGREDATPDFGATHPDASEPLPEIEMNPDYSGITVQAFPGGEELSAQEVYERVVKSTVTVAVTRSVSGTEQTSTGTGIIASSDGYIITNSHVVLNSKSSRVKITTYDGQEYDAVVVGTDRSTDLAVLKTNDYSFTPAEFGDSEELVIGDSVIAIGNPGGRSSPAP